MVGLCLRQDDMSKPKDIRLTIDEPLTTRQKTILTSRFFP